MASGSKAKLLSFILIASLAISLAGCASPSQPAPAPAPSTQKTRAKAIPASAIKMTPQLDTIPPKLHSSEFQTPVPLGSSINTAGAEDSAFILPDGNTIYFFFTPDASIPAEKQLDDGVTGIYVSHKQGDQWGPAQRAALQDNNQLALDGCVFVGGNTMWFCSARKGNLRGVDLWIADFSGGKWSNWRNVGEKLNIDYQVGEMHITADGNEMYFHSSRPGGKGNYDIWVTRKVNGEWQQPENIEAVNTSETDGWPFITQDGKELWFLRQYQGSPCIFRSKKINGKWSTPELIVSQFAAEPSLDNAGNLYFTRHFIKGGKMIEADIYIVPRK